MTKRYKIHKAVWIIYPSIARLFFIISTTTNIILKMKKTEISNYQYNTQDEETRNQKKLLVNRETHLVANSYVKNFVQ